MLYPPLSALRDRSTAIRLPLDEEATAPPEPISESEIREELRIALTDEAHRIETNAIAGREWIEQRYGLALIPGTHRCTVTATPTGRLDLPIHPVTAVLSVSIGLLNLFPVPLLDGGHLLFYAIEAIRGRPLSERAQEYGFRIGLAFVMLLMIVATWNDIFQLFLRAQAS